jgi:hypothetical protein
MGRLHRGGVTGGSGVGDMSVTATTFTAPLDQDIIMDAVGTGIFKIASDAQLQAQGDLRFADADSSNYVAFQAPSTVGTSLTWTLPATDGSANQVLTTNGSNTLSWSTAAVAIADEAADTNTNYLTFTTASSGDITSAKVSTTKLSFQPSTGLLSSTELTVNGTARSLRLENIKTASHTLALVDQNKVVAFNGTSAQIVTVPPNSSVPFPVGSVVYINRINSGTLALQAGAGVSLSKSGSFNINEEIYCRKRASDTWIIVDSPTALSATGGSISSSSGYQIHTYTSGSSTFVLG